MGILDEPPATLDFTCPRCRQAVTDAYYGPCDRCRAELRLRYQAEASEVLVADYEPKMNVTPNAVALKDD